MKQNKIMTDNKEKIQDLKRLRESAYKEVESVSNGITVIAEDEQESAEPFALSHLSIFVIKTEE